MLAKEGADKHSSIDYLFHAAAVRKKIAVLAPKMYITIWDMHITASGKPTQDADDADIAEVERVMHEAYIDGIYEAITIHSLMTTKISFQKTKLHFLLKLQHQQPPPQQ